MRVIPVAGHDSMLLNLSAARAPLFARNLLILKDSAGKAGVGKAPGGEPEGILSPLKTITAVGVFHTANS
jgi:glucarate dehydratase